MKAGFGAHAGSAKSANTVLINFGDK